MSCQYEQTCPVPPQSIAEAFVQFPFNKQIDVNSLQPAMIADMDVIPLWADMPSATTVDSRGICTVPNKTTGHEKKKRLTVCLIVKADGTKMKLYVVILEAKIKKKFAFILGVVIAAMRNGWMNKNLNFDWVENDGTIEAI